MTIGLAMVILWFFAKNLPNLEATDSIIIDHSYQEILAEGITPKLSPGYEFPTSYQYLNGCFGFAVGHILKERGKVIDMLDMESRIQKPREELWKKEYKERLAQEYNLKFKSYRSPEVLFKALSEGESVIVGYEYPLGDGGFVLHAVAAYSFDEKGLWVSETLSGLRKNIPYEKIFNEKGNQTLFYFTRVIEN